MSSTEAARTLRRFNRSWSRHVGALDESFLGTGRSLGESRLLFEIGAGHGVSILDLRNRLELDSGYLSRLLRSLEQDGLVEVRPDPADRRRRIVVPTARGVAARDELDLRSERLAVDLVATLTDAQRERLRASLDEAERLLRAGSVTLESIDPGAPEAVAAVRQYFHEIDDRFPSGFDPGDAATSDVAGMSPPHGIFLVARSEGAVVACGGVQPLRGRTGEIKRMWVRDDCRGMGLGRRLLGALEVEARALGYRVVNLDTNGTLSEAIAMYERSGYEPIERYNDNPYAERFFSKRLG